MLVRVRGARLSRALWPALALLGALLLAGAPASAQKTMMGSYPEANAVLASGPRRIELYLAEPAVPGSVVVRLIGVGGADYASAPATVDPADPRHVVADLAAPPPAGDWTVAWSARPTTGGAPLAGTFPFRVGPPGPPGAAPIDSEWPAAWAAAARWLFALGVALAAGGAVLSRAVAPGLLAPAPSGPAAARRTVLAAVGATVALLATLAEPLLLSLFPPTLDPVPFSRAFSSMPPGWLARAAAALLLALLPLSRLATRREAAPRPAWTDWATLALALLGAGGLSVSGHPAGQSLLAGAAGVVHAGAALLLVGGALALAVARPAGDPTGGGSRLAWIGLALAVVAALGGLGAAVAVLPRPSDLWGDSYGWLLLAKLALLAPLFWLVLRAAARRARPPRRAVLLPVAAAFAAAALLASAYLPLLARPGSEMDRSLAAIDLAAALPIGPDGAAGRVHLALQPARPGRNTLLVRLSDANGGVLPAAQAPMIQVDLRPLDHDAPARTANPLLDASGGYAVAGVDLAGAGWWQAIVTAVAPDGAAQQVPFYFVLPDPNVTGAGPRPSSDPAARPVFDRAMETLGQLRALRYTQRLSDGVGLLYQSLIAVTDARDGQEQAFQETTPDRDAVIVGDTMWIRQRGGAWEERAGASLPLPSTWAATYVNAQGLRLGPVQEIAGEQAQVITFYLPRTRRNAPAWYAWWVSLRTGNILREAMISTRHYMVYNFSDFNGDIRIVPPAPRQGPPGERPAATPTG